MSVLDQPQTKRLMSIHGWCGTLLGLLLYAVIFTGAIVVFEDEINTWSQGALSTDEGIGTQVDHKFRVNARDIDRSFYEEVQIFRDATGDLRYLFHTHHTDEETGQIVEPAIELTLDAETQEVTNRWEGDLTERPVDPGSALRRFWVDLHVQLYVPSPWGLFLTGALGLAMMTAAISGLLIHKHVVRDAFVAARSRERLVGARDLHVLAGSWGLPFAILLAFTGAFFSFATTLGVPLMAMVAFEGNQEAMIEAILGAPTEADLQPAPLASLDYIIADAVQRTGGMVQSIQIMNYDSIGAQVNLRMGAAPGDLTGALLGYDGVSRGFLGVQPAIGQAPSIGSSLIALIAPLHFGNFAGVLSKTVWLGLGLAMAYVTATGMLLWTKRREDDPLWQRFQHWVYVVIWGLPGAMLISAVAYFLTLPAGDPLWWTPMGFLVGAVICIGLGLQRETAQARLRGLCAVLCIGLPVLRLLTGGTSWAEALIAAQSAIIVVDVVFLLLGLVLLRKTQVAQRRTPAALQEPAE